LKRLLIPLHKSLQFSSKHQQCAEIWFLLNKYSFFFNKRFSYSRFKQWTGTPQATTSR
jgi:hypothetical protein